jgi:hypothetical protein
VVGWGCFRWRAGEVVSERERRGTRRRRRSGGQSARRVVGAGRSSASASRGCALERTGEWAEALRLLLRVPRDPRCRHDGTLSLLPAGGRPARLHLTCPVPPFAPNFAFFSSLFRHLSFKSAAGGTRSWVIKI